MNLDPIDSFSGDYRWLSNFWPCDIVFNGILFDSVEKAYVAAKTDNKGFQIYISQLKTPGEAKRFGRTLPLRKSWDLEKKLIMVKLIYQKFSIGSGLATKLLDTGDRMIMEGNTWDDTYWGVCKGVGSNNLGRIIMNQRSLLRYAVKLNG